jgi:hypothetical protein
MRDYWIFGLLMAVALTISAGAQTLETSQAPAEQNGVGAYQPDAKIAVVLKTDTQSPLAPRDLLATYEQDMGTIALATCQSLGQISSALRQGQISDEQAEYASRQTYAIGMMQFQMLSTLHDILYHKVARDQEPGSQIDRADAKVTPREAPGLLR